MNILKKVALAAALTAGVLGSGAASAVQVCGGCNYRFTGDGAAGTVAASYIGSYDPTSNGSLPTDSGDFGTFTHGGLGIGGFIDYWIFQVNPSGAGEWDATFNPGSAISDFRVKIFATTGLSLSADGVGSTCENISDPAGAILGRKSGACGSFGALGSLIGSNGPSDALRVSNLSLPVGWYAVEVRGTVENGTERSYSGNLSTFPNAVPEPGSLALAAIGLLAAGAGLRRRA